MDTLSILDKYRKGVYFMESTKIYEDSLQELDSIRKHLAFDNVSIHMDRLDAKSKEEITYALANVVNKRYGEVSKVITGVQ
jgi:hypothetical protein